MSKLIVLPYPPSMNRYWRSFRGRMVRSPAAVDYKLDVQRIATDAGLDLLGGCVKVNVWLHPPLPKDWQKRAKRDPLWMLKVRRMDTDNCLKVAIDALQGVAYESDRQIVDLTARLANPVQDGGLSVLVEPVEWVYSGSIH